MKKQNCYLSSQSIFKLPFFLITPANHPIIPPQKNTHKSITESVTLSTSPGDFEGFAGLIQPPYAFSLTTVVYQRCAGHQNGPTNDFHNPF